MVKITTSNSIAPPARRWNHQFATNAITYFLFLALISSFNSFSQAVSSGTVPITTPAGGFAIDGNLRSNVPTVGVGDWIQGPAGAGGHVFNGGGTPLNSTTTYHLTDLFTSGDNVFEGGLKKDHDLNSYTWKTGNPSPSKCDINHFLMHVFDAPDGDTWITLAGDRESTNGNSFISIALLQKTLLKLSNGTFDSDVPSTTGGRTVGDVQISAEFTGGGSNPNLYLEEWRNVGGVYKWVSFSISPMPAFGATNSAAITDLPYTVFGGSSYTTNSFIEVSFNISEIYRNTATPCVGSISTMFVMTKSSQAVNADLSDFVEPLQINLDINVGKPTASGAPYCVGQTIQDLTATGETGATFKWYSDAALTNKVGTGSPFASGVSNASPSETDFYVTQTIKGCESQATKVTIKVNPNPTASAGNAPTAQCFDANGNTFALDGSGTNGTPKWTIQTNTNNLAVSFSDDAQFKPNVTISGGSGSVTLRLTVTSNQTPSCGSQTSDVTVVVNPNPTASAGNAPTAQCFDANGNTFTLNGSGSNGNPSWAVQSNPDNLSVQITDGNTYKPSVTISGSSNGGSVTLRLTVTSDQSPSCGTATSDVTVTVNDQAAGPDARPETVNPCTDVTYKVKVHNPEAGTYTLTQPGVSGSKTFEYPKDGSEVIFTDLAFGKGFSVIFENTTGCVSQPTTCSTEAAAISSARPIPEEQKVQTIDARIGGKAKVLAAPNPFTDKVRFTLQSEVSGQGSLEIYNVMGQKVATVYQGHMEAGKPLTKEYVVQKATRANLIYVFRVGNQKTTGKLLNW